MNHSAAVIDSTWMILPSARSLRPLSPLRRELLGHQLVAQRVNLLAVRQDAFRVVEHHTRTDYITVKYAFTVDDPGAYTKPWNGGFMMALNPGQESFEFICQDNNLTDEINNTSKSRLIP